MVTIGPSTGWLYAQKIFSLSEQEKILRESGANGLEIGFNLNEPERIASLNSDERFGKFDYKSLHLPDYEPSKSVDEQVSLAKKLVDKHDIQTALVHPLDIPSEYYTGMTSEDIPLAIENMDKDKASGYELDELKELVKTYGLRFVLDVQHAFEQDPEMDYAQDLFEMTKEQLVHLHVSGETDTNNHELVYTSDNKEMIVEFIGIILSETTVPIILEGEYNTANDLEQEIDFLTNELNSLAKKT